ncbi:hypothetical protein ABBQ32_007915 [Trebouxia sp. C0010 RCD-2024]
MQAGDAAQITAQQQANWDRHAETYSEVVISNDSTDLATLQVISAIKQHKNLPAAGAKFLDIASSAGRPAVPLAKAFPDAQVTSTDLSPKSVSLVSKYAEAQGVTNLTAQAADAQNLQGFHDNTFSVVTCSYGLFFMPEATKALREAYRVLQPGGLFVVTVWAWPDTVQMSEVFMGVSSILKGNPVGHGDTSPMALLPWDISAPRDVQQALTDAHFADATCTEFQHPLHMTVPDAIKFIVGPGSQLAPMLDKMKASGRENIQQEAVEAVQEATSKIGRVEGGVIYLENTSLLLTGMKPSK